MTARRFELHRDLDVSGVSGVGIVAEGVLFSPTAHDHAEAALTGRPAQGKVVVQWLTAWPTSVVWHDRGVDSVEQIHGHAGATRMVWLDDTRGLTSHDYDGAMADLAALVQVARPVTDGDLAHHPVVAGLRRYLDLNHPPS